MADDRKETPPRPLPTPSLVSQPFWDAANEGRLVLQFDPETGKPQFWPRPVAIQSGRSDLEWREVSGKGRLHGWTRVHVPARGFQDLAPYVLASVELDEGARIIGRLVNVEDDEITPGMDVRVAWERLSDEINFFVFEPVR
ncbi:MAG: OB-fold domain-containing protein [Alphaproteobacteria bacterium]